MHPDDILGYIVVTAVVIIPSLALTARFILAPLFQNKARRGELPDPELSGRLRALEADVKDLKEQNAAVQQEVESLRGAEAFYRALQLPAAAQKPNE